MGTRCKLHGVLENSSAGGEKTTPGQVSESQGAAGPWSTRGAAAARRAVAASHRTRHTLPEQATIMLNHYLPIIEFLAN
jgi:hypothetical protein